MLQLQGWLNCTIAANQIELTEHFDLFLFIVVSSLSLCPVYIYVAALRFQLENFVSNSVLWSLDANNMWPCAHYDDDGATYLHSLICSL